MSHARSLGRRNRHVALVAVLALITSSCSYFHVYFLASDTADGRQNGSAGSEWAIDYIISYLSSFAEAMDGTTNPAAYRSAVAGGTNVIGVIPGTDLADEYVVVGAHHDHMGSACSSSVPTDTICNGATDNAAGVAVVLEVARALTESTTPPRRSVILALWDREEDGLAGSKEWVDDPSSPIDAVVAYVNFDILGANLLPSLRSFSAAVGAESGGAALQGLTTAAIGSQPLDTQLLSVAFGQGRSDYVNFLANGIPSVFFSDSTGPCYHTAQDEFEVLDRQKLQEQTAIAVHLTEALASTTTPPSFVEGGPLAVFDDAVVIHDTASTGLADLDLFTPSQQATLLNVESILAGIVAAGPAAFDVGDAGNTLVAAGSLVSLLTAGECDGYLE